MQFEKVYIEARYRTGRKHKKLRKTKKLVFQKNRQVENADFYKPALNKIMTTHE